MNQNTLAIVSLGDNIHTIRWANSFAERDWDVTIISTNNKKNVHHRQHPNIKIFTLDEYVKFEGSSLIKRIQQYRSLKRKLKGEKYDIIHAHFISHYTYFLTGLNNLIISLWGKDIIWDYSYKEPIIKKMIKKAILKRVNYISTTSNFLKHTAISYFKNSEKKIRVIPFGVKMEYFVPSREKLSSQNVKLVFIKHLEVKYGPMILLEAFKKVVSENNNIELILVGDGSLRKDVLDFVEKNNLQSKVHYRGKVSHEEIISALDESDIFVMPSVFQSESFGVAAIEASAMELPIIVTRVGGVPEVIVDHKTGLLIEPNKTEELKNAIEWLIENKEKAKQMGKYGRIFTKNNYSWDENVNQMHDYYNYIISQ